MVSTSHCGVCCFPLDCRGQRIPLSVYKDTNVGRSSGYQADLAKVGSKQWDTLGTQKDRNKENKAIPTKWTSYKVNSFGSTYCKVFYNESHIHIRQEMSFSQSITSDSTETYQKTGRSCDPGH